ncbi:DUF6318 family protein [Geodermatophilus sp. SYSU D01105]
MDVTRGWSLRLVAGLGVGAAVLGGCSAEQEAADTLPSADAPVATEEELPPLGPEDLPMPDEARTQDAAGAEAFVRYYIDLINRTSTVMDAAPLREFSDGCEDCDRIAADYEADASAGYRYEGGQVFITRVGDPLLSEDTAELTFRVDQERLVIVNNSGQPVPDLTFDRKTDLLASAALRWDQQRQSWVATYLAFT